MKHDRVLEEAISLTAERWNQAAADSSIPNNINLRDRVSFFAAPMRKLLIARFPDLRVADDQVLLLIVTEGIARSGSVTRERLEKALGIILPPDE